MLFLREWYMHPNGQLPAYEFNFGDVNPPVHAWACWRVYKMTAARGQRDRVFLSRCFQKLVINFTWWVNRKDLEGRNLFAGGFLGLDNIGVFDRSKPLPTGGHLQQADGTAWMAFYCATMLSIALELARDNPATEDMASKFFEHFVAIADAMNTQGGTGLWDEEDGFYYDQLRVGGRTIPLKVRSLVGLIPLLAVEVLDDELIQGLRGFKKRMDWFLENRPELSRPHLLLLPPGQGQGPLPPLAGHPDARRSSSASCATCSTRTSSSRPTASAPFPASTRTSPTSSVSTARNIAWTTSPASPPPASSAATPTGAARCGSRSITCSSKRWNATTTIYGDGLRVECPTGSGECSTSSRSPTNCVAGWPASFCGCAGAPSLSRRGPPLCRRPALARPGAVPRILPRRNRPRPGRQPSDGLDGPRDPASRSAGPMRRWRVWPTLVWVV